MPIVKGLDGPRLHATFMGALFGPGMFMVATRFAASAVAVLMLINAQALARTKPRPHPAPSRARAAHAPKPPALPRIKAAPSFGEALAQAWALLPQRQNFAARRNLAAARYESGSAWFPNAPYATGTYINDKIAGSNYNYETAQGQFSTPLWLPGQGTATQATAQADAVAATAAEAAARHALALELLNLTAQATAAVNTRDVEARRLGTAQALAASAAKRFKVGEGSESDALAAAAEAAAVRIALSGAEAQIEVARASLASLTGRDAIPRLALPLAAQASRRAGGVHPQVAAAERAVQAAQANLRLVRISDRNSPEIGVEGINEKQPGTRWDTRFGVTFRLPFATEARNAPLRAQAEQQLTQAQVQLELARRQVLARLRQAEAEQAAARQAFAAAEQAAGQWTRRQGQIERAWRLGEMALIELVRANALAYDAELARAKAQTGLDAARIRLLLAQGAVP